MEEHLYRLVMHIGKKSHPMTCRYNVLGRAVGSAGNRIERIAKDHPGKEIRVDVLLGSNTVMVVTKPLDNPSTR